MEADKILKKKLDSHPQILVGDKLPTSAVESLPDRIKRTTREKDFSIDLDSGWSDWYVCQSENLFERLFLDKNLYSDINDEQISTHFHEIDEFWEQMLHFERSGTLNKKQYPGINPTQDRKKVREAYERLKTSEGRTGYFRELEQKRIDRGKEKLIPHVLQSFDDGILEPSEEGLLMSVGREAGLTDREVKALINEMMAQNPDWKRGEGGSSLSRGDKMLYSFILRYIDKNELQFTSEDDQECLELALEQGITESQYEKLVIQALRERYGSERQKTIERDKKEFAKYYYSLLQEFGLTDEKELNDEAKAKLHARDTSDVEFFPLSTVSREKLVLETTDRYNNDLIEQSDAFFKAALKKLDKHAGHERGEQELMSDKRYTLLLPRHRQNLLATTKKKLIDTQAELYYEALKNYYQHEHWSLSKEQRINFLSIPEKTDAGKHLHADWLTAEKREELWAEAASWASSEHEREVAEFKNLIHKAFDEFELEYGLPVHIQCQVEGDENFYLSSDERREILLEIEDPLRKKADADFTNKVKESLVHNTLIPEVETNLREKGESIYLLTSEKNEISVKVNTTDIIIDSLRKPFEAVMKEQVQGMAVDRRMDDTLIKEYNMQYTAYISRSDVNSFIETYKPANKKEEETIEKQFQSCASEAELYISDRASLKDYLKLFIEAVEKSSKKYKLGLKKWFTAEFKSKMIKIGAAYGVSQNVVERELNTIKREYPVWTRPRWGQFIKWFLFITSITFLFYRNVEVYYPCIFIGTFFAGIAALVLSTRRLRRSYLKHITISILILSAYTAGIVLFTNQEFIPKDIKNTFPEFFPKKGQRLVPEPKPDKYGLININIGANIRSGPTRSSQKIASLAEGTKVKILKKEGNWYKIVFKYNNSVKTGYVFWSLVDPEIVAKVLARIYNLNKTASLYVNGKKISKTNKAITIDISRFFQKGPNDLKLTVTNLTGIATVSIDIAVDGVVKVYKELENYYSAESEFKLTIE